jgi:glucose/arabinose dehydrogenase/cytochrome c553
MKELVMITDRAGLASPSALAVLAVFALPLAVAGPAEARACSNADAGITLPKGFCATIFADKVGHARQMVVAPDGTLYVNTWSGPYYGDKPPAGGFLLALSDRKGTGRADMRKRFGVTPAEGGHGGTGIGLYKGALYAEINDRIVRYPLKPGEPVPSSKPETVLRGMPLDGDHPMHPFAIDAAGNLFVSVGSATNSCEIRNRMPHAKGNDPCTELATRAGIWRYDANKTGQVFSAKERYASGLRNPEGLDFDAAGRFYATQHGRDQLHENWSELYTAEQGFELPAEEVVVVADGASYGWPMCYYDGARKKLVLAPEYGGDGGKKVGVCASMVPPIAAYPAHWAPNDLKIYNGAGFPQSYRGGAFIAFHGSWNRAPGPQGGYNVVFQPLKDGAAAGRYVVFADGFAGRYKEPGRAAHRPSGLAVAPDGALFISDDKAGRIWRVAYEGDPAAPVEAAPGSVGKAAAATPEAAPPEGINPEAGGLASLPVPPGSSPDQLALGRRIFHGQAAGATCAGCHGADGIGTPVGPDLTNGEWLWSDGSLKGIAATIKDGVAKPKRHPGAMPPYGGIELKDSDLDAVAAYVWALGHRRKG